MLKSLLLSLFFVTSAVGANVSNQYQISGNIAGLVEEGEVILTKPNNVVGGKIEITRGKVSGGAFFLSGEVGELTRANVQVLDVEGKSKGSVNIVLEPAQITISYHGRLAGMKAEGGKYNQMLITSWEQSDEYKKTFAEYEEVFNQRAKMADGPEKEALKDKVWKLYYALPKIRSRVIDAIAISDEDPVASLLAIQLGALGTSEQAIVRLNELETILGARTGLVNRREAIKGSLLRRQNAASTKVGQQSKVFSAKNIAGESFELSDVLKRNEYVLVEFWASWCGPCRNEIPHMKKAYQQFSDKGFEIFSFSLDDDRELWVEASEEEALPWINTSDLKAYASPVVIRYGVNMIPRNFLLDKQGQITATDLRGDKLAEKLKELLGE
ncbi:TlpA disulfide reductase family protein [Porticoccaceae bacterium LTM1]|nr:TlpA disulfide reductase family protein [Porticoccaceae bacterium LTM1]